MEGSITANDVATRSLVRRLHVLRCGLRILAFGLGSAPDQLLALAPYAAEIHVVEQSLARLDSIRSWQAIVTNATWSPLTRKALAIDGVTAPSPRRLARCCWLVERQLTCFTLANPRLPDPLGHTVRTGYDCIVACLAAAPEDTNAASRQRELRNLASLLKRDGTLLVQMQLGLPYSIASASGSLLATPSARSIRPNQRSARHTCSRLGEVA
jgi:hypothetical protein